MMLEIYSTEQFEAEFTYTGNDLGATWTKEKTSFRLWAPTAIGVKVNLYQSGTPGEKDRIEQVPMRLDVNGTWVAEKKGDLNGDGKITALDIVKLQRLIVGLDALNSDVLAIADINGDGKVTALDIVKIQRHIVGLETIQ